MILLITGSPAAGKTTIGSILAKRYGFKQLDGDQVIKELGLTSKSWNKIHDQIFDKSLTMHTSGNVVITHVVLADKFAFYQNFYKRKKIPFEIVLLKPQKKTLLSRNKIRTCHPQSTPLDAIDFFYSKFRSNHNGLNNSEQTPEDTAKQIFINLKQKITINDFV